MTKEIKEKTFELNITKELLDTSSSFKWYLNESPVSKLFSKTEWSNFLKSHTFYALGLTQSQEQKDGYDLSINIKNSKQEDLRIMYLQFKSGFHRNYSLRTESHFNKSNPTPNNNKHILFSFNDDSKKSQHVKLRELSKKDFVNENSVMYVFPRITKLDKLIEKMGSLVYQSSFIPISEIDKQAKNKEIPKIKKGQEHKFRISYNGAYSEVNYYYYGFDYNKKITTDILCELILIQIERLLRFAKNKKRLTEILNLSQLIIDSIENSLSILSKSMNTSSEINDIKKVIEKYLNSMVDLKSELIIPAPTTYTNQLSNNGLNISFEDKQIETPIYYQIF